MLKGSAACGSTQASTRMVEANKKRLSQARGGYLRLHSKINREKEGGEGRKSIV